MSSTTVNGSVSSVNVEKTYVSPTFDSFAKELAERVEWFGKLTGEERGAAHGECVKAKMSVEEYADVLSEYESPAQFVADLKIEKPQEEKPQYTIKEVQEMLHAFGKAIKASAEANYDISQLAIETTIRYVGAGSSNTYTNAVQTLAQEMMENDPSVSYLFPPAGKDAVKHRAECVKKSTNRVYHYLHYGQTARILFGASVQKPVVTLDGTSKRGRKDSTLAWMHIKTLSVLVERYPESERSTAWRIIPKVESEVQALVQSIFDAHKAGNLDARLKSLAQDAASLKIKSLEARIAEGIDPAMESLKTERDYWIAKEEKKAKASDAKEDKAKDAKEDASEDAKSDAKEDAKETASDAKEDKSDWQAIAMTQYGKGEIGEDEIVAFLDAIVALKLHRAAFQRGYEMLKVSIAAKDAK